MPSKVEEIEAILREHLHPTQVIGAHHYWTDEPGLAALSAAIAALRAQDREDGARAYPDDELSPVQIHWLSCVAAEPRTLSQLGCAQHTADKLTKIGLWRPQQAGDDRRDGCLYEITELGRSAVQQALPLTTRTEDGNA